MLSEVITSKKTINVLGVVFDSKLNWDAHVASAIRKAKKSLFALRLLKKFFNQTDMRTLLDSNFYSILYYNSVIWLTPSLNSSLKQNLLSISAKALRSCIKNDGFEISFVNIHKNSNKCTPNQIMLYQIALNLHKLINDLDDPLNFDQIELLEQIVCTRRQLRFEIHKNNNVKIGMNTVANKLYHVSNLIGLDMLNLGFVHFKKLAKIQFLKNGKT